MCFLPLSVPGTAQFSPTLTIRERHKQHPHFTGEDTEAWFAPGHRAGGRRQNEPQACGCASRLSPSCSDSSLLTSNARSHPVGGEWNHLHLQTQKVRLRQVQGFAGGHLETSKPSTLSTLKPTSHDLSNFRVGKDLKGQFHPTVSWVDP